MDKEKQWFEYDERHRTKTMFFYVGADAIIYRDGIHKTYRAELIKRDWPREILAVASKIRLLNP